MSLLVLRVKEMRLKNSKRWSGRGLCGFLSSLSSGYVVLKKTVYLRVRERVWTCCCLLVHSPKAHDVRSKARMLSLGAVFHMGGTDPTTGAGSTATQGLRQQEAGIRSQSQCLSVTCCLCGCTGVRTQTQAQACGLWASQVASSPRCQTSTP